MNADKSKLLVVCKPGLRSTIRDIILQANAYTIQQSDKVKILGVYFTSGLDQTPNMQNIIQKVNYRIYVLNNIIRFTNIKTRLILYNSLIISIFTYCLENLSDMRSNQLNILNVLLNKCSHKILGITSYRLNTTTILNKLNWLSLHQMIIFNSLKLIHRISF